MSENKINLVVPKEYNGTPIEVVLREGKASVALDPKEPERVVINGTIGAPFRWLEKRVELINQKSANIIVNRDKMCLALTIDETNYYQTVISGILQASKEMLEFGINTDKKREPIKLSQFFKMHRAFFKDKSENMMLVSTLKNFKAKVNQDIERSKEENGSKTDNYSQVVDSNLPKSFKLNIPLFKGFTYEEIEVEIYADVDGREVSLSLVSAGANEAIEEYKQSIGDEAVASLRLYTEANEKDMRKYGIPTIKEQLNKILERLTSHIENDKLASEKSRQKQSAISELWQIIRPDKAISAIRQLWGKVPDGWHKNPYAWAGIGCTLVFFALFIVSWVQWHDYREENRRLRTVADKHHVTTIMLNELHPELAVTVGAYEKLVDVVGVDSTLAIFNRQVKTVREEDNQSKRQK